MDLLHCFFLNHLTSKIKTRGEDKTKGSQNQLTHLSSLTVVTRDRGQNLIYGYNHMNKWAWFVSWVTIILLNTEFLIT